MVKVERRLIPVKLSWTGTQLGSVPFNMPFNAEVINTPRLEKVKMPNLELYDGTADPEEHLVLYKAHTYVQDMDDAAYYRYFHTTLKGWRRPGLMAWPSEASLAFRTWKVRLLASSLPAVNKGEQAFNY